MFWTIYGISHTGTSRTEEEKNAILIKEINGIKIGFISYTYDKAFKNTSNNMNYLVNTINKEKILNEIKLLKLKNVDIICANVHLGNEYKSTPNKEQEEIENFLYENDVDIVYMSHPYVLQPIEQKQYTKSDGTTKDVFTIYSLGNFTSGQTTANTNTSVILNLEISKNENNNININYDYTPICMINNYSKEKKYMLFDTKAAIQDYENNEESTISEEIYIKLKNSLEYVEKVLGK